MAKILVVDDERGILNAVRRVLRREQFEVMTTDDPHEALRLIGQESFAVILSDQRMPAMEGTQMLEQARGIAPDTVRIILTGYVDIEAAIEAINRGAVFRFITKPWDDDDLRSTLRQAVAQFELVEENRRLTRDLRKAHEDEVKNAYRIQQTLLRSQGSPDIEGVSIAALSIPSQQIDGDFYDLFRRGDRVFDVLVGDVMGKGVPAAILGAATKNQFLRAMNQALAEASGPMPAPQEIVGRAHAALTSQLIDLESFVTACYARFDLDSMCLTLVDCGHTKTVHCHAAGGDCATVQGDNMPLGFSDRESYVEVEQGFASGDMFFFYSDGLSEAQDAAGELFGTERLMDLVRRHAGEDPETLVARVREAVEAYNAAEHFSDDLTCVAVKIR